MTERSLLYCREYPVTDHISVVIPTVGEVIDKESDYYTQVSILTATPMDYMVQLDDVEFVRSFHPEAWIIAVVLEALFAVITYSLVFRKVKNLNFRDIA